VVIMPKSLYAIAGMGLAGCVLLSLMMQQALKSRGETQSLAVAAELEDLFRGQLAGPVEAQVLARDGRHTLRLRLKVARGVAKQGLAMSAGGVAWSRALEGGRMPDAVVVQVTDDGSGAMEEFQVPQPPFHGRMPPAARPTAPATPARPGGN
jgi:hypothetical protein